MVQVTSYLGMWHAGPEFMKTLSRFTGIPMELPRLLTTIMYFFHIE
jgi:hypothetical protein